MNCLIHGAIVLTVIAAVIIGGVGLWQLAYDFYHLWTWPGL